MQLGAAQKQALPRSSALLGVCQARNSRHQQRWMRRKLKARPPNPQWKGPGMSAQVAVRVRVKTRGQGTRTSAHS